MYRSLRLGTNFLLTLCVWQSNAQTTGDYRSAGTGNWTVAGTWERFNGRNSWPPVSCRVPAMV